MKARLFAAALQLLLAAPAWAGLRDGLAAYYSFEANVQDQSGNGRHLTTLGTPEAGWAGGTVTRSGSSAVRNTLLAGKALNLVDADGDYLKAPLGSGAAATAAGSFDLGGNFTLSAWHYLAPLPNNTSTRYFVFEGETNFDVSWGISSGDTYVSYNSQTAAASIALSRNAWHHVVHVFETVGGNILLTTYVDGVNLGQTAADVTTMDFSRLVLGNSRDGQDRKWDGLLDEVAVWNRALTPAEVATTYQLGKAGAGLDGSGGGLKVTEFAKDASVNGYRITWATAPGLRYTIEASSDLADWTTELAHDVPATGSTLSFQISPTYPAPAGQLYDPNLAGAPRRFYRVHFEF